MNGTDNQTSCNRCGTCCQKGGPTLHSEDIKLLQDGHISPDQLITIRQGEFAISPFSDKPEPSSQEFVKVAGKNGKWNCCFLSQDDNSCSIYGHRPLECRLLKCWDTALLKETVGKNLLSRKDIVKTWEPVLKYMAIHDRDCSFNDFQNLIARLSIEKEKPDALANLTELVRRDLAIRSLALKEFDLPVSVEVFLFGRPVFMSLSEFGLTLSEKNGDITLNH